jgi:hypothetical protein
MVGVAFVGGAESLERLLENDQSARVAMQKFGEVVLHVDTRSNCSPPQRRFIPQFYSVPLPLHAFLAESSGLA